jgi:cellobiose-specific phosphotransferase system component IIC
MVPLYATVTDNDAIDNWMWNNFLYVVGVMFLGGLAMQVVRIIRSRDRNARDLLLLTVGMLVALFTLGWFGDSWSGIHARPVGLGVLAWRLGYESLFMAVPLIYGLAVMWILVRRGHWNMDVQLKGSVGYAGLTTFLVLSYFGIVAVVQAVVNDVSGAAGNTFAIMVSTAVIAVAFLPARSGLQRLVDRIFDRRRRDAEIMVQAFETSVVRDSRPDEVAGALLSTVDEVFRPEHTELWLTPGTQP